MMKKIFSIFITVLLLLQMPVTAFHFPVYKVGDISTSEEIAELKRYGVLDEDFDDSEEALSANITRGEFAKMIAIIMGGKDYVPSGEVLFDDVDTDSEYYPYIEYLARADAISTNLNNGKGEWAYDVENFDFVQPLNHSVEDLMTADDRIYNFYPDRELQKFEAVKLIVIALGCGVIACRQYGNYPESYFVYMKEFLHEIEIDFNDMKMTVEEAVNCIYRTAFGEEATCNYFKYPGIYTTLKEEFLTPVD